LQSLTGNVKVYAGRKITSMELKQIQLLMDKQLPLW